MIVLEKMQKRFSVGLTLDSTIEVFEQFLQEYHIYIENFYFSLPLGDKFHAREKVIEQMNNPDIVSKFWNMLKLIPKYDIKLELVLNNGNVSDSEVRQCKTLLDKHQIDIDLIGITDDLYESVRNIFEGKELVYSFKNHTHTISDFKQLEHSYDSIVLGRQNIRNEDLFAYINEKLQSKVVLLVNNGCSHVCGGCTILDNCHASYYRMRYKYSPEYLYALQSLMPYEIHENYLDISNISLFKISSRNDSLEYLKNCLNSYIHCIEDSYINSDVSNYLLWGRLAWHSEYYDSFSLDRIRRYKSMIYEKQKSENLVENTYLRIELDLRDRFIFCNNEEIGLNFNKIIKMIEKETVWIPYKIESCFLGASNCRKLLKHISYRKLYKTLLFMKQNGLRVFFEFPELKDIDYCIVDEVIQTFMMKKKLIDCVVVNDWKTESYIRKEYHVNMAYGSELTRGVIEQKKNSYMNGNDLGFGDDLIALSFRKEYYNKKAKFIVCDMPEDGLCISVKENISIKANVNLLEEYKNICHYCNNEDCDTPCIQRGVISVRSHEGQKRYIRCNAMYRSVKFSRHIKKTILENRLSIIVSLNNDMFGYSECDKCIDV